MDKIKHIDYWFETSKDDWEAVHLLYEGKKYLQSLFFCHLCLEKKY